MRRAGLRVRVIAGFAGGALALSATMALVSYQITRQSLLAERERTAERAAVYDASVVRAGLKASQPDIVGVLRSLDTGENRRAVLRLDGEWYARSADPGLTDAITPALQDRAVSGEAAVQRLRTGGHTAMVLAVPISPTAILYEVDSLQELEHTLRVLTLVLTFVAISTAAAGAVLGWYSTGYVLRPLTQVAKAAQEIAAGASQARLNPATEPDLARLTSSFNDMVDELSARNERDRRFAADVSHELRSPLQTLAAAASVLTRRRDRLDERTATAAGLVADEVERFQGLANDLIELARSDRPADRVAVDVLDLARQECRARKVPQHIVTATGPQVWTVDRRRLAQLLGNLLDNADAYGGGPTAVRLRADRGWGIVEVDDEGPGVSPDDKPVIFDRFVRGRSATARADGAGTGLGLALVAQHANAHGGTACVLDRPGGGARFRVELAAVTPVDPPRPDPLPDAAPGGVAGPGGTGPGGTGPGDG
ncbi:sensor histidine kinase, partial [Mangrovihabitans endophyticus]|uniref:sensor histidine kinase n=1 Tax=Mangrovihabitans endophyticus TaxID=1751298 RepID=UPI00166D0DF1